MVEEERERIENAMRNMIDDVDKAHLRDIQAEMHRCAAACCENKTASIESVQNCVQTCNVRFQTAQSFVQQEFDHFQNRLQRCIMTCNDSIRDKMGVNPTESEIAQYTAQFERCAKKCVDSHIDIIPSIMKKMKEVLSKKNFQ